jgi:DNA polymerase kappa
MTFMASLPVRKVNGIGRVFERELEAIGIKTCGDIFAERGVLRPLFGQKACDFLLTTYLGLGRTQIRPAEEYERKSVGTESTFRDLSGGERLREKLRATAEELEKDLKNTPEVAGGKTIVLKVKLHTYEVLTRQRNLGRPVAGKEELYSNALPLLQALEQEYPGLKIRLMGLRVTGLVARREKVDVMKWFFGGNGKQQPQQKRKLELDEDGWEVWPEEEFEQAQQAEKEEELQLTRELEAELEAREKGKEKEARERGKEEPAAETWECPICGSHQPADDTRFNQHMDFCLSKEAIRSAVRESSRQSEGRPPAKKKKQLVFPGPSKR